MKTSANQKNVWLICMSLLLIIMSETALAQLGSWTNNSSLNVYQNGPNYRLTARPSDVCEDGTASCGTCGQVGAQPGTYHTYFARYHNIDVEPGSALRDMIANFTGTRTVYARIYDRTTTVSFNGFGNPTSCSSSTSTHRDDHTFSVTGHNHTWTSSLPNRCNNITSSINLYNYFGVNSGVTFSGPGVSGNTWSADGLSAGTKTITATRTYDNGTASVSTTVTVYDKPTVTWSSVPTFCQSDSDPNLDNWTNVNGTYSSATATLGGTRNRNIILSSTPAGNHTITMQYTNGNGCTESASRTITISAQNTVDAGSNQEECKNSGEVNLVASTSGVSWSCVGCSYVSGGKFDTDSAPAGVYTVRATKTVGACTDTDDKTFTVKAPPTVQAGSNFNVCIDEGTITLGGNSPLNGTWSGPGVSGNSMNLASAGVGSHTITYTYTGANGCTNSDTKTISVIALPNANTINVSGDTRCGAGTVSLSASLAGHTIKWYSSSSGGSELATGNTYSPSVSVGTTNYYVEAINSDDCVSPSRKLVTAIAYPIPSAPSSSDESRCGPGTVTFTASSPISNPVFDWFENSTGGSSLHTGSSFTTPSLSTTRSYYIEVTSEDNCNSSLDNPRTEVQAIINTIPGAATVTGDDNCGPGTVVLQASGAPTGGEYRWYDADTGGTSLTNTNTYSVSLSATTSYWVSIVSADGCEGDRAEVVGTIYPGISSPNVNGDDRCGPGTVTLSASASNVQTFNWYDTEFSGVSIANTSTFSPSVTSTRSYWVEYTDNNGCVSPREEVVATVFDIPSNPSIPDGERCGPGTVILTASGSGDGATYDWFENASGGSSIHTGESFTTPSLSTSRSYFVEATSSDGCLSTGRTQVDVTINAIPGAPVTFDGESCGAGVVELSVGGAPVGGEYRWYNSDTGGTSFNTTNSYDADITGTTSYWVSIVNAEGCEGERAEIIATINPTPNAPIGTGSNRCGEGQVSITASGSGGGTINWYATQASNTAIASGTNYTTPIISSTTSYWAEFVDDNGCVSARTEVVATIHPVPEAPTVSNVNSCGQGIVTITASGAPSGAQYRWYDNATGGSAIATGSIYEPNVSTTRKYYVDIISDQGCVSTARTEVTVTINSIPSSPTVFDGESCGEGVVNLQVGGGPAGSVYRWYEFEADANYFHTGSTYNPTLSSTKSYWVAVETAEGCEGSKQEIVASILDFPSAPTTTDYDRCGEGSVQLVASNYVSGGEINWYVNESGGSSIATGASVTVNNVTNSTIYYATVTNASGCESDRTPLNVTINPITQADIGDNFDICVNASGYDLTQDLSGVTSSDGFFIGPGIVDDVFYPSIAGVGNHEVTFVLESEIGCTTNGVRYVTVLGTEEGGQGLELSETEITTCQVGIIDLNVLPNLTGGTWSSDAPSGSLNSGIFDPVESGSGEFEAVYTKNVNGCTVTATLPITVLPAPATPVISGANSTCAGGTIELEISNVQATATYNWYLGSATTPIATGTDASITVNGTQTVRVISTNTFGCDSEEGTFVINSEGVPENATVSTSPQNTVSSGEPVVFETNVSGVEYEWVFSTGLVSYDERPVMLFNTKDQSIDVTLNVTFDSGCSNSYEFTDVISVVDSEGIMDIPSTEDRGIDVTKNGTVVKMFPTPTFDNFVNVRLRSIKNESLNVQVYNISHELLSEDTFNVVQGENTLDVPVNLNAGIYIVMIRGSQFDSPVVITGVKK